MLDHSEKIHSTRFSSSDSNWKEKKESIRGGSLNVCIIQKKIPSNDGIILVTYFYPNLKVIGRIILTFTGRPLCLPGFHFGED